MTDEKFEFLADSAEKKRIARSAFNKRTHCGKGGSVRLPSDFMTKGEIEKMNGEVKSYRMNDPITWQEFRQMPDDIRIAYIKLLREKFNAPNSALAKMFGVSEASLSAVLKKIGVVTRIRSRYETWDKDGFLKWIGGNDPEDDTSDISDAEQQEQKYTEKRAVLHSGCITFSGSADEILKSVAMILGNMTGTITVSWTEAGGDAE